MGERDLRTAYGFSVGSLKTQETKRRAAAAAALAVFVAALGYRGSLPFGAAPGADPQQGSNLYLSLAALWAVASAAALVGALTTRRRRRCSLSWVEAALPTCARGFDYLARRPRPHDDNTAFVRPLQAASAPGIHAVEPDHETVPFVDVTAAAMLDRPTAELRHREVRLVIARSIGQVCDVLGTSGLGQARLYYGSVREAVAVVRAGKPPGSDDKEG